MMVHRRMQVPEAMHADAVAAALVSNARIVPHLRGRLGVLQAAQKRHSDAQPPLPAMPQGPAPLLLGPEQFAAAGGGTEAYGDWLRGEIERTERGLALQREHPECQAVVTVEGLAAKGLRAGLRRRGRISRFVCCAAPQGAVELDALFFKIWVAGSGESATAKQCAPPSLRLRQLP